MRWYIGLVIRPVPTIREIVERRPLLAGILALLAVGFLVAILIGIVEQTLVDSSGITIFQGAYLAILLVFVLTILSVVVHFVARSVPARGRFKGTYGGLMLTSAAISATATAVAFVLFLLDHLVVPRQEIVDFGPIYSWFVPVAFLWFIFLAPIVVRQNYGIGWVRSIIVTIGGLVVGLLAVAVVLALLTNAGTTGDDCYIEPETNTVWCS